MDKRGFWRFPVNLKVRYRILESLQRHRISLTEDMSEVGIKIDLAEYLEPNTYLELIINLDDETKPILVIGKVIWVRPAQDKGCFSTGIQLLHIRKEDRERFYKYALL